MPERLPPLELEQYADLGGLEAKIGDRQTAYAIEKYLGLRPWQVALEFSLKGHYLREETLDLIREKNINLLLGEFDARTEAGYISDPTLALRLNYTQRDKLQGLGGGREEVYYHWKNLQDLVINGMTLVFTDSSPIILDYDRGWDDISLLVAEYIARGLLAITEGLPTAKAGLHLAVKGAIKKLSRREFMRDLTLSVGGTAVILKTFSASSLLELDDGLDACLSKVQKPEFVSRHELVRKIRNTVMDLNTWYSIARRVDDKTCGLKTLFLAGDAHKKTKKLFLKGPQVLEGVVGSYTSRLFTDVLDLFINEEMEDQDIAELLTFYGELFSHPASIGYHDSEVDYPSSIYIPRSAREMLFGKLDETIDILPQTRTKNDHRQIEILQEVKRRLVEDEEAKQRMVNNLIKQLRSVSD